MAYNQTLENFESRRKKNVVDTNITANPADVKWYCLRLLLNHVKGAISFGHCFD